MELFRLLGTIAIDNQKAVGALNETSEEGQKTESKMSKAFGKIGSAAAKVGKAVAVGMAAAGTAIVKIGKDAVASYADYEQLVGGVETLFKDSADVVMNYAQNAYKTAGLSANQYMETVTSFSASLLQSLDGDTKKAAESANLAITDMSDNANKMGTSMESIQNAYQGFAKQNYTMLDNLKLGYGGTKEEMERLLADASKLSGIKYDISSFDDMVQAIHVVQTEMGITGTTAKEAATTIQGSVASMKSAWQNLLTGMADENQNLDLLFGQFVDSVVTVGNNVIPRIQALLPRLVEGVSKLAQQLATNLPAIVETLLPSLITGAVNLVAALVQNLPALVQSIVTSFVSAFKSYYQTIKKNGAEILDKITKGIEEKLPKMLEKAGDIITKLVKGLADNLPKIISAAGKIIGSLITGLVKALPSLIAKVPTIIATIVKGLLSGLGSLVDVGLNLVKGLWNGIKGAKDWVLEKIKGFGQSILDGIKGFFGIHSPSRVMESQVGKQLALGVAQGITKNKEYAKKSAAEMSQAILDAATKKLDRLKTYNKISIADEVTYWDTIRKQCEVGTDARLEADKQYYEARKNLQNQMIVDAEESLENEKKNRQVSAAEEAGYWAYIVEQTKKGTDARIAAEEKYYAALESYKQQYDSYVDSIMDSMNLFEAFVVKVDEENPLTGQELIANLQSQIGGLESYYNTMDSLQSRIGGTALMEKLQEMGTDSLAELQAINGMTNEQLQQYVDLYDQKYELAKQKATEKLGDVEAVIKNSTEAGRKKSKSELSRMSNDFKTYTKQMADTTASKFSNIQSTIASKMAAAVSSVKSAVAEMNEALAGSPAGGSVNVTTAKVKKNAEGGILTKPTIFGYTPSTNTFQLGGEAGAEAIAPIDKLQGYVRDAVAAEMSGGIQTMIRLLEKLVDKDTSIYLNSKEISKAVNKDLGVVF